ncbi:MULTISPECIES: universal stress protein [Bizionia]|uniref:Universal stress protein n=1 Tax=Bizionia algoritergicola TaxID=291187 RepID=A0A5D0QPH8_9FLAO|nr:MULTISPECIES: universal stress protein [Bizionia]OBX22565.1 universal stress protein UspA [Bizionia sp. APA-3]TYB70756.1 universal stress protein [Bizionia algoritergicola]
MKKIIVPIDFSEYSEYALETAAILAKKNNAEILALHMLELSEAILTKGSDGQMETVFFIKLAEKRFTEFLDKSYLDGVKVTPIVKHFKVFSEVNEVAKVNQADLIIMGSQGSSGIKEYFVGSNTEKVVRYSEIPVLVIKHNPILTEFETIVFASDFSDDSVSAYLKAKDMCSILKANMNMVYVNLPGEKFKSTAEMEGKIVTFFKKAEGDLESLSKVTYVSDYTVEQGISNFANLIGADLVAIATHGRKGIAHFFEGSISEDVANHSTLPVMTFKI